MPTIAVFFKLPHRLQCDKTQCLRIMSALNHKDFETAVDLLRHLTINGSYIHQLNPTTQGTLKQEMLDYAGYKYCTSHGTWTEPARWVSHGTISDRFNQAFAHATTLLKTEGIELTTIAPSPSPQPQSA